MGRDFLHLGALVDVLIGVVNMPSVKALLI
jgi:hypothetical protein